MAAAAKPSSTYYVTSLAGKGLKVLSKRSGQIDEATLVERHPVEFQGEAGSRLTGYFLLRKGVKKGQRVPYVVLRGPGLFPQNTDIGLEPRGPALRQPRLRRTAGERARHGRLWA